MKTLEENCIYSNDDLADWFGVKPNTFRANKKQKLETLKMFAEFEEVGRGKILITKVEDPVFAKGKKKEQNNSKYKTKISGIIDFSGYQNCANITRGIVATESEMLTEMGHHSYHTAYAYVRNNVRTMYVGSETEKPTHGIRSGKPKWCKSVPIVDDYCRLEPMPPEEYQAWKEVRKTALKSKEEEADEIEIMYYNGEITQEQAQDLLGEAAASWRFVLAPKMFAEKYGYRPVPAYYFENSAFIG